MYKAKQYKGLDIENLPNTNMLLPYTTAEWWYLGAGGVPVVNALLIMLIHVRGYKKQTYSSTSPSSH